MEYHFKVTNIEEPYTLPNRTITSHKEVPQKSNLFRIKLVNVHKREEEMSGTLLRGDDEQKKASGSSRFDGQKKALRSSRFEGKPSVSSDESTDLNTCTEELFEDSFASKAKDTNRQAHDNLDSIDSKYEHICKICNKTFESERALSGHKRIHSDKIVKKEVSYQDASRNQVSSNLEKIKWIIRGKRSRKRKLDDDTDDQMIYAPENLLYFSKIIHMEAAQNANRDSTNPHPGLFKIASEMRVGGKDRIITASYIQEVQSYKEQFKKMLESDVILSVGDDDDEIMEVISAENAKENVGTSSNQENCESDNDVRMETLSDKSQEKRIELESGQTDALRVYVCQVCYRSFASYQALGGHTVSHNKGKNKQGEAGSKMSEHKCKICGQLYKTGQSLGGHMRKHYDPDKSKNLCIGSTLQTIREDNSKDSEESCSANAMEESEQLLTVYEDKGKKGLGGSSSAAAMEETESEQLQIVNKDSREEFGESVPGNTADQTSTRSAFDLNELPDDED